MKCVDLFASCGGLSLGFLNAGIEVASAIDNWDKSVNVYNDNFSNKVRNFSNKVTIYTMTILLIR